MVNFLHNLSEYIDLLEANLGNIYVEFPKAAAPAVCVDCGNIIPGSTDPGSSYTGSNNAGNSYTGSTDPGSFSSGNGSSGSMNAGIPDPEIAYISYDSQDIRENTLFICKGAHFSEKYLFDAIRKGACAYVSEKPYKLPDDIERTPWIKVDDIRKAMPFIAGFYYNNVWTDINMIGITGTKGKSSTTYFVKAILDEYMAAEGGCETAVVSGIDNYDGVIREESHLTTPEIFDLYRHIDNAVSSGIKYLAMEVSSQGLKYGRVAGITYDVGCFLNIGTDHISDVEHPDFDDYFQSKLKIFSQCRIACINMECDHADEALAAAKEAQKRSRGSQTSWDLYEHTPEIPEILTFGYSQDCDFCGHDITSTPDGTSFKVRFNNKADEEFFISLKGLFNVENALAAIAITTAAGVPVKYIKSALETAKVSGRMEFFKGKESGVNVIVDYAHNQLSFETLFQSMKKEFPDSRISIVFGCPGKKAYGRRRELGEIAGKYADHIYITEEDPGEEPVHEISLDIAGYVEPTGCSYDIIDDRGEAIKAAIEAAGEGDVVLITGKGRETRQKRGIEYIDTPSDVDYTEEYLK